MMMARPKIPVAAQRPFQKPACGERISMRRTRLASFLFSILIAVTAFGRHLPNIDKLGENGPTPANAAALEQKAQTLGKKGVPLRGEPRLGIPTFLWGAQVPNAIPAFKPVGTAVPGQPEGAARAYLGQIASLYNLGDNDVAEAPLSYIHDLGKGPVIVKLHQQLDGIDIFREEINVVMNQRLDLIAVSGYISSKSTPPAAGSLAFRLGAASAAANAVNDLTLANVSVLQLVPLGTHDGYDYYTLPAASGATLSEPVRMKKVYFHTPEGLTPGYYVEVIAANTSINPNEARIDTGDQS